MQYDVIVIGAGPAGIFSAIELTSNTELKILLLDKGYDLDRRKCPAHKGLGCVQCEPCSLLTGWGGSGAFSDGKLTLSADVGGWLGDYCGREKLERLIDYVDKIYQKFGAPSHVYGSDLSKIEPIKRRANAAGLKLIPQRLRHLGTDKCKQILREIHKHLKGKIDLMLECEVKHLLVKDGQVMGVQDIQDREYNSKYVIVAPGRSGAEWLRSESEALGLKTYNNPVDIGIRVEVRAEIMEELTNVLYEPKLVFCSPTFQDKVRTFCVAPHGEVLTESYGEGILTVNGQSYASESTENTNFAILVSVNFTYPFREPILYGKYLARLTNILSGGVIIQRLGDLNSGQRSTEDRIKRANITPTCKNAAPGDLSFVIPHRHMVGIKEMLKALDKISPGLWSRDTLLYGLEVKFYSSRVDLTQSFETKKIKNLFTVGDGAGITRGLVQSSISGVVASREIMRREGILGKDFTVG